MAQQAEKLRPDVVVMDITMPDLNGIEVLRQAKRLNPWTQVILITAHGDERLARDALKIDGAYDYLAKPLDLEELRKTVNRAARQAMTAREAQHMRDHLRGVRHR